LQVRPARKFMFGLARGKKLQISGGQLEKNLTCLMPAPRAWSVYEHPVAAGQLRAGSAALSSILLTPYPSLLVGSHPSRFIFCVALSIAATPCLLAPCAAPEGAAAWKRWCCAALLLLAAAAAVGCCCRCCCWLLLPLLHPRGRRCRRPHLTCAACAAASRQPPSH
jgi:hypothetical protein